MPTIAQFQRPVGSISGTGILTIGPWRIDQDAREATDGDRVRRLSPRAMQLLLRLAETPGEVVSRSALMDHIWPGIHVGDESLTQAVAELRRAFGSGTKDGLIETVPKSGYRLTAPVLREVAAPAGLHALDGPGTSLSIEAHVAATEARRLARLKGVLAVGEIETLIGEARRMAPGSASILADHAVLMGLSAIHAGRRRDRLQAATVSAEEAVALRPDLVSSHRALGFVAGIAGKIDTALQQFACALTIDPQDVETHYLASQICFGAGDLHKAIVLGERAAELDPQDYRPAYNAARAALHLGDHPRAMHLARIAAARLDAQLALSPDSRRYRSARAAITAAFGGAVEAPLPKATGGDDGVLFYDIVTLAHFGEIGSACALLEELVERGWSHTGWLFADPVHHLLRRERRYERAIRMMDAA